MNNPFGDIKHIHNSYYCVATDEALELPSNLHVEGVDVRALHHQLRDKIVNDPAYPCVAAKSAFNKKAYRFGVYETLGSATAAAGLARDLFTFIHDRDRIDARFATYLSIFLEPRQLSEAAFEQALWKQLRYLHEEDRRFHNWSSEVSHETNHEEFGFSFAERAFFIVGMHANSSRVARQFPFPMLVFNLHRQFQALRETGDFERMKEVIRERELDVQGSLNPMLSDFGRHSEAVQYSGREVSPEWKCPVHFHTKEAVA